ncbi:NUDIX domain-containing protein [Desulfoluna sp.]|uniref:NUDIX domain-containing protein n=1 Tax=Desulfoluna sp. TaxID=2045199 RepID=UPI0026162F7D|nr:NUDIX domain-containing protein [Desulfoluna sp.]
MNIVTNIAKAIISDGQNVLLIMKEYEDGQTLYTLPGGRQAPGETLEETVRRHVHKELAASVNVLGLLGVYEHNHPARKDPTVIQYHVEFAFLCELIEPYDPVMGHSPDPHQISVEWIQRNDLHRLSLHPEELGGILKSFKLPEPPAYLGNVS